MQKEFKDILIAIKKWEEKNKGDIFFIGTFMSFDRKKIEKNEDNIIKDDIMVAYGSKEEVQILLDGLNEEIQKEKEEFINW